MEVKKCSGGKSGKVEKVWKIRKNVNNILDLTLSVLHGPKQAFPGTLKSDLFRKNGGLGIVFWRSVFEKLVFFYHFLK